MISTPIKQQNQDSRNVLNKSIYLTPCAKRTPRNKHKKSSDLCLISPKDTTGDIFNGTKLVSPVSDDKENIDFSVYLTPTKIDSPIYTSPVLKSRNFRTPLQDLENSSNVIPVTNSTCSTRKPRADVFRSPKRCLSPLKLAKDNRIPSKEKEHSVRYLDSLVQKSRPDKSHKKTSRILVHEDDSGRYVSAKNEQVLFDGAVKTDINAYSTPSVGFLKKNDTTDDLNFVLLPRDTEEFATLSYDTKRTAIVCSTEVANRSESYKSAQSSTSKNLTKFMASKLERVRRVPVLRRVFRLKIFKRSAVFWSWPCVVVKNFASKCGKKMNTFGRLVKRRITRGRYYIRLRNIEKTKNAGGTVVTCCLTKELQYSLISSVKDIQTRLECIEKDLKYVKEILADKRTYTETGTLSASIVPPPPVPPPLPPFLFSSSVPCKLKSLNGTPLSQNHEISAENKSTKEGTRSNCAFRITEEDLKNVRLRRTPHDRPAVKIERKHPVISVEMLRSVKLKPNKGRKVNERRTMSMSPYSSRERTGTRNISKCFEKHRENSGFHNRLNCLSNEKNKHETFDESEC